MSEKIFAEIDLVQAEWVVTAYFSQDSRMLEVIEKKLDPHTRTGSLISGAPEHFVDREAELVGHLSDPIDIATARKGLNCADYFMPRTMSLRQAGKKGNHGLNYDEGYKRFALENEITEKESKTIVEAYHTAYPGVRRMHRKIVEQLRSDRTLKNCHGEKQVFWDELNDTTKKSAYSWTPQSTVARVNNAGVRFMYEGPDGIDPLANEHDSTLVLVYYSGPQSLLAALMFMDKCMTMTLEYHAREFVLDREIKIGFNWGENSMIKVEQLTLSSVEEALRKAVGTPVR